MASVWLNPPTVVDAIDRNGRIPRGWRPCSIVLDYDTGEMGGRCHYVNHVERPGSPSAIALFTSELAKRGYEHQVLVSNTRSLMKPVDEITEALRTTPFNGKWTAFETMTRVYFAFVELVDAVQFKLHL